MDNFNRGSAAWDTGRLQLAFEEFSSGAKLGDASCQVNLGYFYDEGVYVSADVEQALYWYRQAHAQGDAAAASNIGSLFRSQGESNKALWWFRRAGKLGDGDAFVEVANMYERGLGVKESTRLAQKYYRLAATQQSITPSGAEEATNGLSRTEA